MELMVSVIRRPMVREKLTRTTDAEDQTHIIICKHAFDRDLDVTNYDTRSIAAIKTGLKAGFGELERIEPLGKTLFHEFTHTKAVGGVDANGQSIILDGDKSYGFKNCRALRIQSSARPVLNADSYTELALGLSLQFRNKFAQFTWAVGRVDTNTYQPQPPPRNRPPKHRARDGTVAIEWSA